MSAATETAAHVLVRCLDAADSVKSEGIEVTWEPESDVRSGGTFFEIEDARGHKLTVLVFEEGA